MIFPSKPWLFPVTVNGTNISEVIWTKNLNSFMEPTFPSTPSLPHPTHYQIMLIWLLNKLWNRFLFPYLYYQPWSPGKQQLLAGVQSAFHLIYSNSLWPPLIQLYIEILSTIASSPLLLSSENFSLVFHCCWDKDKIINMADKTLHSLMLTAFSAVSYYYHLNSLSLNGFSLIITFPPLAPSPLDLEYSSFSNL